MTPAGAVAQPWLLWALGAAVFAALTAIFAKLGVARVDSDVATLIRTLVLLPLVAAIAFFRGGAIDLSSIGARTWLFLVLSGFATGLSWLCYFRALQLGDAARVAPVDKLSVVLVAMFAAAFLGERLAAINWLGVAMVAAGVVLLAQR